MSIINLVENTEKSEFYPTPDELCDRMLAGIDWKMVRTVLEPSAGKGNILKALARAWRGTHYEGQSVDYIEIDANLREVLKYQFSDTHKDELRDLQRGVTPVKFEKRYDGRYTYYDHEKREYKTITDAETLDKLNAYEYQLHGFFDENTLHLVHDDFLTFEPFNQYDLIVMNPPFSNGDMHLLKALEIQKRGGSIVCLLNAETIRNPYTESRKRLVKLLDEYDAQIEYIENAFSSAERKTGVEVALIRVCIPDNCGNEESIYERLVKSEHYEEPDFSECTEIEMTDYIEAIVNRYKVEVKAGIELIYTYKRMLPYLCSGFGTDDFYDKQPIIGLNCGRHDSKEMTVNRYVRLVRLKYWKSLLTNEKFIGKLTSELQSEYRNRVTSYAEYDFSKFNIQQLVVEMHSRVKSGIEDAIGKMYDKLTQEHTYYPECSNNRHYYNGWTTNKAWKIGKKVIIPSASIFSSWDKQPRTYEAYCILADIERILNYFDGNMTADIDLNSILERSFRNGITANIQTKFFKVTFYKKGTVHLTFTCPELIDRFNIYAAQQRKWLPPSYGKKTYEQMSSEEQAVVDEFQGKEAYAKVLNRSDYYLTSPTEQTAQNNLLMLAG